MTQPRQILPGKTYAIARRCTQREHLLPPGRETNKNIEYCLALAAERTGVWLHAVCFMSNHWHGVVSDPEARLPEFLETFHKLLSKCQNALLGRWENLWSLDKTSVIPLESDEDVLDKMAYALANPTAAGLVSSPEEWPGVISRRFGEQRLVAMPDVYFDSDGDLPDAILLEFRRPPVLTCKSDREVMDRLREAVAAKVRRARATYDSFAGPSAVLKQAAGSVPSTNAPRRVMNPRIAARSAALRVDAIRRLRAFRQGYREAWCRWRDGDREVVFPFGTYALRIFASVNCLGPAVA